MPATVVVMLGLSLLVASNERHDWESANAVIKNSRFISSIANFVHELQVERGVSALYLGAKKPQMADRLNTHYKTTDRKMENFNEIISNEAEVSDKQLASLQIQIITLIHQLDNVRHNILEGAIGSDESFEYYTNLIKNLLLLQQEVSHEVSIIELHEQITIIREITLIKEMTGQIRGLGSDAFSSGKISSANYSRVFSLISTKNNRLSEMYSLTTPEQRTMLNSILTKDVINEITKLQNFLLDDGIDGKLSKASTLSWFNAMTVHINDLKKLEYLFSGRLLITSNKIINQIKIKFLMLVAALFVVFVLMTAWLWSAEKKEVAIKDSLQNSLRSEQERSQKILEAMSDAVCVVDRDGDIEFANPAMVAAFGDTVWKEKTENILPCSGIKGCALTPQGIAWAEGRSCEVISPVTKRSYSIKCSPFNSKNESDSRLVVLTDITSHILTEQRLQEAKDAAESANQTKSEILANMSHELRTPLNAIIGFSDAMLNNIYGQLDNERYLECAKDINSSGIHLLELINDILDVSAIEAGKVKLQCDDMVISDVVNSAFRLINPQASKGKISLHNNINNDMPMFNGDVRRMKQIMLNLVSNAVKFTSTGGSVTVSSVLDDGAISISVSDTGIGMGENDIEKALERFGQVDSGLNRKHEGTGLGLPLVKGLVEVHGGTLSINSFKGKGTTVSIRFPPERTVMVEIDDTIKAGVMPADNAETII